MALWFHNFGENILQHNDTKKIGKFFLDRVDADGSLILARDKNRKLKQMIADQEAEGFISNHSEEYEGSSSEEE